MLQSCLKTSVFGRAFESLGTVDSTNKYIKDRAVQLPDGFVAVAKTQTSGRGRLGRTWQSHEGELFMSVLIKGLPLEKQGLVPLVGGLAAAKALGGLAGGSFLVKWPNDIVCGGKKIAGLLCETTQGGGCVLGIGVNLGAEQQSFEKAGLLHAGSLKTATGKTPGRLETAAAFLNELEPLVAVLCREGFAPLREEYSARCVSLQKQLRIVAGESVTEAFGKAVADDGSLVVVLGDGSEKKVFSGEVSVRGLDSYV